MVRNRVATEAFFSTRDLVASFSHLLRSSHRQDKWHLNTAQTADNKSALQKWESCSVYYFNHSRFQFSYAFNFHLYTITRSFPVFRQTLFYLSDQTKLFPAILIANIEIKLRPRSSDNRYYQCRMLLLQHVIQDSRKDTARVVDKSPRESSRGICNAFERPFPLAGCDLYDRSWIATRQIDAEINGIGEVRCARVAFYYEERGLKMCATSKPPTHPPVTFLCHMTTLRT